MVATPTDTIGLTSQSLASRELNDCEHTDIYEMHPTFASSIAAERPLLLNEDTDDDYDHLPTGFRLGIGKERERTLVIRLAISFFLFGLINNVLYVIILSAALDLVPPSTPKGIIAFCNIAPALVAKVGWPYILKGRIRYQKRLIGCCGLSVMGMVVVSMFDSLFMRLLGISLASFSSGLGELTFLQLSTTYSPPSIAGHSVGYFASGTGAAGLVGAFLWWELRSLGVRIGVGLSSVLPLVIPLTYLLLLPPPASFLSTLTPDPSNYFADTISPSAVPPITPYTPLASAPDEEGEEEGTLPAGPKRGVALSAADKWRLVRPMVARYMLPLFCVYLFEYTINQGIAPTLLYPVPTPEEYPFLSKIIKSVRDYYPLWQLVYQSTVFLSRSSISLGLPALPSRLLSLPAILQAAILLALGIESAWGWFGEEREGASILFIFLLISLEGICGGLAYVNVFYRINQETPSVDASQNIERARQEREFKIGSIGFADSTGILVASLLAVPTEVNLCKAQVHRGKMLCKGL
ncbi:batten's disease protein Cln3 [Crucibulum laeve]|uniref:Protein BTN n=1 Tax=Crucibulum laeve TaxID=68775 RepID=A0A5C3LHM2_9AGAR|nr:batten's disease protein Cln3 [Crucibulum laeve]